MTAQLSEYSFTRHDISLAVIGGVLLVGLVVGLSPVAELSRSLFAASVPATGGMVYTLFYRPPNKQPGGQPPGAE
ncbi:hypothetical protein GRX03_10790 [Halovenus sp. WSH3]|uniref:Uncharacterized protein n=1 Tax=Halovenus carboxidivorans TaxID=2692199 RepID=A0A6B0T935_9EURY|nr:hypothetical protein [Halovenus carboxidivorans]MXR52083.1 hypothetical protein [Halovenus carboxidivorans]